MVLAWCQHPNAATTRTHHRRPSANQHDASISAMQREYQACTQREYQACMQAEHAAMHCGGGVGGKRSESKKMSKAQIIKIFKNRAVHLLGPVVRRQPHLDRHGLPRPRDPAGLKTGIGHNIGFPRTKSASNQHWRQVDFLTRHAWDDIAPIIRQKRAYNPSEMVPKSMSTLTNKQPTKQTDVASPWG